MNETPRDLVGYGASPPDPRWPGGKRVALNLVLNYEEGGENTPLDGDPASEAYLHEVVGAPATVGRRNLNTESMFEFGSRAGFWRVHRLVTSHGLPLTVFGVGQALERNPDAARAMVDAGWEVASHGWRWIDYGEFSEEEERAHLERSVAAIERVCGRRPVGWYTGRGSDATRRLVVEHGGFLYDSDSYADELPYWVDVNGTAPPRRPVHARRQRLQVPAPERVRDRGRLRDVPDRLARRASRGGRPAACPSGSTAGSSGVPGESPGSAGSSSTSRPATTSGSRRGPTSPATGGPSIPPAPGGA